MGDIGDVLTGIGDVLTGGAVSAIEGAVSSVADGVGSLVGGGGGLPGLPGIGDVFDAFSGIGGAIGGGMTGSCFGLKMLYPINPPSIPKMELRIRTKKKFNTICTILMLSLRASSRLLIASGGI